MLPWKAKKKIILITFFVLRRKKTLSSGKLKGISRSDAELLIEFNAERKIFVPAVRCEMKQNSKGFQDE